MESMSSPAKVEAEDDGNIDSADDNSENKSGKKTVKDEVRHYLRSNTDNNSTAKNQHLANNLRSRSPRNSSSLGSNFKLSDGIVQESAESMKNNNK